MAYAKLAGLIREKYGSQDAFAKDMGVASSTVSRKITGESDWTRAEIVKAANLLNIDYEQIPVYWFFNA